MPSGLNRVLYVEDDAIIAELAVMAMEDFGELTVRHCSSGQEALDCVHEFAPELVLPDVMMPEMDGMETLRRLREMPDYAALPAAFMSARVQMHEQQGYFDVGASGVIPKPFDPIELSGTLRAIWSASQAMEP